MEVQFSNDGDTNGLIPRTKPGAVYSESENDSNTEICQELVVDGDNDLQKKLQHLLHHSRIVLVIWCCPKIL